MHRWLGFGSHASGHDSDAGLAAFAPDEPVRSPVRRLLEIPLLIVVAVAVALVVKTFVAQAFFIPSESMVPQLEVGDRVVVSRTAYRLHDPNRGDIVVFPQPGVERVEPGLPARLADDVLEATGLARPDDDQLIKRVIGLAGETIEARSGQVYVDGQPLAEPYLPDDLGPYEMPPFTVPADHVFVMGDNRTDSSDSRVFGPVAVDDLVGRAIAVVWPLDRTRFL